MANIEKLYYNDYKGTGVHNELVRNFMQELQELCDTAAASADMFTSMGTDPDEAARITGEQDRFENIVHMYAAALVVE